jgi:hypothetical protein
MNPANPEPSKTPASADAAAAPPPAPSDEYRAGLEHAMTVVWREKQKLSVITPAYFALAKVWDELYHDAHPSPSDKH